MIPGAPLLRWSLKRTLLIVLLPALLCIELVELSATYRTVVAAANSAYDRSLLGAIKAIDSNISLESGGISVELPYNLLEFFQLTAGGEVYFRVATEDGLAEVGNPDLPRPEIALKSRVPHFYDSNYYGNKVRIGAYARDLVKTTTGGAHPQRRIVIQVAETLTSRTQFIDRLLLESVKRNLLLLSTFIVLLALVLHLTLKPLARLRDDVRLRSPIDLTPIDLAAVPVDVRPLVDAINQHMLRNQQITEARRRFVDDASHQLRTPLATLRTQLDYVRREGDADNVKQALAAISTQLDEATRSTNQILALARADAAELSMTMIDLETLAEQVAREVLFQAREKQIDLELIRQNTPLMIQGDARLLREAALNLLHNAIRFAPHGGHVTIRLTRMSNYAMFTVTDNGPGIPDDELSRLGERFFRARNADLGGSGLGLAIARAIVERHDGYITVDNVSAGTGATITLHLLRAMPETTAS